jgi:ethanolamine ammonia-lyase small subunit
VDAAPPDPRPTPHPPDPWHRLRQVTPARIALGRAGGSLPTRELLDFNLAHALARDAVHQRFDPKQLERDLAPLGQPTAHLTTAANDRQTYLLRPDLGRQLAEESRQRLASYRNPDGYDVSITLSDGLSALAAHRQIPPLLFELLPRLGSSGIRLAPIAIIPLARVAVQDEIGRALAAKLSLILLGERPGLGSPDSLGAYLVYHPKPGNTDADRNCVSNIRPQGLPPAAAADLVHYLITQSLHRQLSGVHLKDDRPPILPECAFRP